jgi:hypothetical protein
MMTEKTPSENALMRSSVDLRWATSVPSIAFRDWAIVQIAV